MTKMKNIINIVSVLIITLCILFPSIITAQETTGETAVKEETSKNAESSESKDIMEDERGDIELYSLEELLNVEVDVASLFMEDELVIGSSVSSISSKEWKRLGARRVHETFINETSVMASPFILTSYGINIRGYTSGTAHTGIAYLIDGVPLNEPSIGAGLYEIANWELGILDKIEMVKGPGSAIYGTDAFHGVVSMKTFESDEDFYSAEAAGA